MKFFVFGLALLAVAYAGQAPSSEYLPPVEQSVQSVQVVAAPSNEYLAPEATQEQTVLAQDGYRYKTVRRLRHRRGVNQEYLPPVEESVQTVEVVATPSNEYLAPEASQEQTVVAQDGYRYKTVRRLRHRNRRGVNQEYLPPVEESAQSVEVVAAPSNEYLAPEASQEQTVVAQDGYRYKTVRRLRHRNRRSVNQEYLPPVEESAQSVEVVAAPSNEYLAPEASQEQTVVAQDGYRYKTVRRLRHRNRRGVNQEYLPPVEESVQSVEVVAAPSNEYLAPEASQEQTVVAQDGYRYKTVRRLRHRNRRGVNQEYLPPVEESVQSVEVVAAPSNEYLAPEASQEQTVVAQDGYRYKTVRRLRHRNRRGVNQEYLPPVEESAQSVEVVAAPSNEYLAPEASQEQTVLAQDGYRYKTVRRHKIRRH